MTISVMGACCDHRNTAVTLRQNQGDMLDRVQCRRDSIVITKDGKPVAALVDAALSERIRAMQERFDALCDRIAKGYENVPEDEGMAEIEQACALARQETADESRSSRRLPPLTPAPNLAQARASGLRDPNDVPILATLIAAGADCLVSGDKDLLAEADRYAILTPADFCA